MYPGCVFMERDVCVVWIRYTADRPSYLRCFSRTFPLPDFTVYQDCFPATLRGTQRWVRRDFCLCWVKESCVGGFPWTGFQDCHWPSPALLGGMGGGGVGGGEGPVHLMEERKGKRQLCCFLYKNSTCLPGADWWAIGIWVVFAIENIDEIF